MSAGRSTPWNRLDMALWTGGIAAAVAVWTWAWWQAAGTPVLGDQLPWVSGALGALVFAAATHASWLLRGRRRIGLRRLAMLHDDAGVGDEETRSALPSAPGVPVVNEVPASFHKRSWLMART